MLSLSLWERYEPSYHPISGLNNSTSLLLWKCLWYLIVTYWPSTEPSIGRYTCVNKRKQVPLNNNITTGGLSWGQGAELRVSGRQRALGPQWTTVEQPKPRWGSGVAMVRRTLGQNNSPSLSPLSSHTQEISTLSRIKGERYFYNEVCAFVRHYYWLCFRLYLYMQMYAGIQHNNLRKLICQETKECILPIF